MCELVQAERRRITTHHGAFGDANTTARGMPAVDHCANVVGALFQRRCTVEAFGQALAAFVESGDAGERGKPLEESGAARDLVHHLDMRYHAGHDDQVDRALAHHLVSDVHGAGAGKVAYRAGRRASGTPGKYARPGPTASQAGSRRGLDERVRMTAGFPPPRRRRLPIKSSALTTSSGFCCVARGFLNFAGYFFRAGKRLGESYGQAGQTWNGGGARTADGRKSCRWRRGGRRVGIRFAVRPDQRATGTKAARAPGPGVVHSGLCGASGSCIGPGSDSGSASGRTTKGC